MTQSIATIPNRLEALDIRGHQVPQTERRILHAQSQPRISEMDPDAASREIRAVYFTWRMDLGVQRSPDTDEAKYSEGRFIQFIMAYCSDLTLGELRVAVELLCLGELDEYLPKGKDGSPQREHYQSLSAEFVMRIINAYRERLRRLNVKVKGLLAPPAPAEPTPEELEREAVAWWMLTATEIEEHGRAALPEIIYGWHFDLLVKCGLLEPVLECETRGADTLHIGEVMLNSKHSVCTRRVNELFTGSNQLAIAHAIRRHCDRRIISLEAK